MVAATAETLMKESEMEPTSASLHLRELNKRSAQFGTWTVVVKEPFTEEYPYGKSNTTEKGKKFECILMSLDMPSEYCIGSIKLSKRNQPKFNTIVNKLKANHAFTMSKVAIEDNAKQQYMHTSLHVTER